MKPNLNLKRSIMLIVLATAGCLLFVTCNKTRNVLPMPAPEHSTANARLKVYLTDSPAVYQQVNVDVIGVSVHSNQNGWVQLANVNMGIYNLIAFNDTDTLIAGGLIDSGRITQVRLILDSTGNSVMADSVMYPLKTPSAYQSGLKLQVNRVLANDSTYYIVLDFNAGKSVVNTGSNTYILKPVITAKLTTTPP